MGPSVRPARQRSRAGTLRVLREAGRPLGIAALTEATGLSAGSVRFHLANLQRAGGVGSVTGLVGAAGGLGGFIPPLVMGTIYGQHGSYGIGLGLLSGVAFAAVAYAFLAMRRPAAAHV